MTWQKISKCADAMLSYIRADQRSQDIAHNCFKHNNTASCEEMGKANEMADYYLKQVDKKCKGD